MTDRTTPDRSMIKLIRGAEEAFLAGRRKKQEDVESAVGVFLEFLRGFELFDVEGPCVTVFGSARVREGDPSYSQARSLGRELAQAGYTVMTGGGQITRPFPPSILSPGFTAGSKFRPPEPLWTSSALDTGCAAHWDTLKSACARIHGFRGVCAYTCWQTDHCR